MNILWSPKQATFSVGTATSWPPSILKPSAVASTSKSNDFNSLLLRDFNFLESHHEAALKLLPPKYRRFTANRVSKYCHAMTSEQFKILSSMDLFPHTQWACLHSSIWGAWRRPKVSIHGSWMSRSLGKFLNYPIRVHQARYLCDPKSHCFWVLINFQNQNQIKSKNNVLNFIGNHSPKSLLLTNYWRFGIT